MSSDPTAALRAQLNALFGKPAQDKAKSAARAAVVKASLASPASALAAYTEAVVRNWREHPFFRPVARVHSIVHQECRCCGRTTSYIAGEWIKYQSDRLHCKIVSAREAREANDFSLPIETQTQVQQVGKCVDCLDQETSLERAIDRAFDQRQAVLFP